MLTKMKHAHSPATVEKFNNFLPFHRIEAKQLCTPFSCQKIELHRNLVGISEVNVIWYEIFSHPAGSELWK